MKRILLIVPVGIYLILLTVSAPITGCTKTKLIHDTTTVTIHDTTVVTDTVGCCNINEDMIAYYTFTGGSLKDSSGNHNDIVFNNATATTDRYGNANGAYLFDGSTSYMRVANSTSLSPTKGAITIMATVKINGYYQGEAHGNEIIGKGYPDNAGGWIMLRYIDYAPDPYGPPITTQEQFTASFGDNQNRGSSAAISSDTVFAQTGQWYTIIYTFDGSVMNLYVNGKLVNSGTKTTTFNPNTNDMFLGKYEDPLFPYWFNGVIDEVRIYNKALCASAVAKLSATQTSL
jgi:hypothetical protein